MKQIPFFRLTIRQRLPLLICTLLLSVILIFGVISYLGIRTASLRAGEERLQNLGHHLSTMLSGNAQATISTTHKAASHPLLRTLLLSTGTDSVTEVKKILEEHQKDSSYVQAALLNEDGAKLLSATKGKNSLIISLDSILRTIPQAGSDLGRIGKIYAIKDSVFYPIMATVMEDSKPIGYLIPWKVMLAKSKSVDQLSQLMGTDEKLYIGNADGSLWTDMIKPVPAPPQSKNKKNVFEYSRAGNHAVLASIYPIANSQWLVAVEFPKTNILQTPHALLYWLLIVGLSLLVLGTFCGWLMSRSISEPLTKLTVAASEIAAGKYSSPVLTNRLDELGKLARSFNAMTEQVWNSKKELEQKAENYSLLFEKNPLPMWIILRSTMEIKDVNEAALAHYGYTRAEFIQLNSKDLRPGEDVERYLQFLSKPIEGNRFGIWRHKKKDGSIIMVDVMADDILYQCEQARLILANDVTEKLMAEAELVRHRVMQQELITETTIQVQEKEREELGKELHDNINQILASTKLYLEIAKGDGGELYPEVISKCHENITLAIGEIRQLSKQLVPPALDNTLADTLQDLG